VKEKRPTVIQRNLAAPCVRATSKLALRSNLRLRVAHNFLVIDCQFCFQQVVIVFGIVPGFLKLLHEATMRSKRPVIDWEARLPYLIGTSL